jgi:AsmA protein
MKMAQVTVRDIRLQMDQDEHQHATLDFLPGRINRDQRDLALSFSGAGGRRLSTLSDRLTSPRLNWQLRGAEFCQLTA